MVLEHNIEPSCFRDQSHGLLMYAGLEVMKVVVLTQVTCVKSASDWDTVAVDLLTINCRCMYSAVLLDINVAIYSQYIFILDNIHHDRSSYCISVPIMIN